MMKHEWWHNAVIYQISPWSFRDTTENGKGDLEGIIEALDYVAALGIDAIWLTPIFQSPMNDLAYDITDMRKIDPMFGTLQDFARLLNIAHALDMKVMIDQVWNHTSDQHPWFQESRSSRDNPKADWYVWADPKEDGSPPNNWLSAFMGESAWQWAPERQQFYFYNFLPSQPDLNWHNPDVVQAIIQRATFWLELGVDGFRLDAPNFLLHDPQLRDNPTRPDDAPLPDGVAPDNPIVRQLFKYNFCRPEILDALKPIRDLVDQYPGVATLAEVTFCEDSIQLSSEYVGPGKAHLAYNSALLVDEPISPTLMRNTLTKVLQYFPDGGNCWIVGNHDYGRFKSCWTGADATGKPYPEEFYHLAAAMLLSLPGAFCLYQGDELGLPEASIPEDIPPEEIKDPFGKALYPDVPGRDGSRTPMPWKAHVAHAGFTMAQWSWLPIPDSHIELAVDKQHPDPNSLLNTWRRLIHWRKHQPALVEGRHDCDVLDTDDPVFGFIRRSKHQQLLCLFNFSDAPIRYDLPTDSNCQQVEGSGFETDYDAKAVKLPAYGVFFANLSPR
ncbi:MAG: alpha-glucosidase family protein [Elainellaceae cyanobacterium]